jgi:activator of 2-hydroxyglutaryl-CoA dehydratase
VEDLAAGVLRSLATRIAGVARAGGPSRQTALVGGGACNPGLVTELARLLGDVVVPPEPRVVGALGAALAAAEDAALAPPP